MGPYTFHRRAVRGERFKLIRFAPGDEEMYDLEQDPHELNNLAAKSDYQSLLNRMREACRRWQFEIHRIALPYRPFRR